MIYLTFSEYPSGVFKSQVIDRVVDLNKNSGKSIQIVSFISFKKFFYYKNQFNNYKKYVKNIYVIPMFPFISLWKVNLISLLIISIFLNFQKIQGRGPFATYLALILKRFKITKYVLYDGRGATYAETVEYKMHDNKDYISSVYEAEKESILKSDFCIAVSNALVGYWKSEFKYDGDFRIEPCKPNIFKFKNISEEKILNLRYKLGFDEKDIIIVFSGGNGLWQSYDLLYYFFKRQKNKNENLKLVLLCPKNKYVNLLLSQYPESVKNLFVKPNEVHEHLLYADYGFLIRHDTITNRVSSPVKFGEYIQSGLKVLISDKVGDYSKLVQEQNLGLVIKDVNKKIVINRVSYIEKKNQIKFFENYFK